MTGAVSTCVRFGLSIAAALALAAAASPANAAKESLGARLHRLDTAFQARDCKNVRKIATPLLAAEDGIGLPEETQAALYHMLTYCALEGGKDDEAYALALRGTGLDPGSNFLWMTRLGFEIDAKNHGAAVTSVEALARGRPTALNLMPIQWMWRLDEQVKQSGDKALRRRLLVALAGSYDPADAVDPPEHFRLSYARLLGEAGEREAARAIVEKLEAPTSLVSAMLEPSLRTLVPRGTDLRTAAEKILVKQRQAIAANPKKLAPLIGAAHTLRMLGRHKEALDLLKPVGARAADPKAFDDRSENLNWYWNSVAQSHRALGHYEEASDAYRTGAESGEGGAGANVSQIINLASLQIEFARGDEALKTLAAFDDPKRKASPYGLMQLHRARACARAAAGRPGEAAADVAYARAHEADAPQTLAGILICVGDLDGAAAVLIRSLDDPERRSAALLVLSDFDEGPFRFPFSPETPGFAALKARADVKAAIARAGGTLRIPLQAGELY